MNNVIDMLTKMAPSKAMSITARFEQIIASQLYLMLRRGIPQDRLLEMVGEAQMQIDLEDSELFSKVAGE